MPKLISTKVTKPFLYPAWPKGILPQIKDQYYLMGSHDVSLSSCETLSFFSTFFYTTKQPKFNNVWLYNNVKNLTIKLIWSSFIPYQIRNLQTMFSGAIKFSTWSMKMNSNNRQKHPLSNKNLNSNIYSDECYI